MSEAVGDAVAMELMLLRAEMMSDKSDARIARTAEAMSLMSDAVIVAAGPAAIAERRSLKADAFKFTPVVVRKLRRLLSTSDSLDWMSLTLDLTSST